MNAVIIYEIANNPDKLKNAMKAIGYFDIWMSGGKRYHLPSNTVWKPDTTLEQAYADIRQEITKINTPANLNPTTLDKCIVLSSSPFVGLSET